MSAPHPTNGRAAASRLRAMDALRRVAALAVVLFHFTARDHVRWGSGRLPHEVFGAFSGVTVYGYAGVHLFFVVSGFVILMSVWGRSVPQFLASRMSRLYPAYWVAVLLTATLRWWWPTFGTVPRSMADACSRRRRLPRVGVAAPQVRRGTCPPADATVAAGPVRAAR